MKWIYPRSAIVVCLSVLSAPSFSRQSATLVYGLANAQHFSAKHSGAFTIQVGSFSNKNNALRLQSGLRAKTKKPVNLLLKNGHYIVTVGPVSTAEAVRTLGRDLNNVSAKVPVKTRSAHHARVNSPNKIKPARIMVKAVAPKPTIAYHAAPALQKERTSRPFVAKAMPRQANWYAGLGVGGQFPTLNSSMTVKNGSDYPAPLNVDLYSTNNDSQAFLGISAGRRWQNESVWLPALSVGVLYEHFFANNAGGTITQYSLPEFTNYTYKWNVSSNDVLATAKLNLFRYEKWSPFINGGLGLAFNTTSGFNETALAGVTARVSPGFASNTSDQFAYNVGAGLDYQVAPQWLISLGYLYQDLGHVSSGQGAQTWSADSLSLGAFRSNDVFASVTYLFGK